MILVILEIFLIFLLIFTLYVAWKMVFKYIWELLKTTTWDDVKGFLKEVRER
jgi:hypothetical protein